MSDEPKLPRKIEDTIRDSVDEAFYAYTILLNHLNKQVAAESIYNAGLIMKIVFEKIAEYMIAEHGWIVEELCAELLGDPPPA